MSSHFNGMSFDSSKSALNPIDSEAQTNDTYLMEGNWDTETGKLFVDFERDSGHGMFVSLVLTRATLLRQSDHMLSYFLADDGISISRSVPQTDFASTATSSPLSSMAAASDDRQDVSCNAWQLPPPTPAVQFYSRTPVTNNHSPTRSATTTGFPSYVRNHNCDSPSQQHPLVATTSQSSSSSSLSSMAAALVSGVAPGLRYQTAQQMHMQRVAAGGNTPILPTPPVMGYEGESPLSPAAMIGSEHENLMLPPPSRSNSSNDVLMGPPEPRPPTLLSWQGDVKHDVPLPPSNSMMGVVFSQPHRAMNMHVNIAPQNHHQHQQFLYTAALQAASLQQGRGIVPEEESEEKRAKRLERNRESARKCRRRKKERLTSLGTQVNQLHNTIESERSKLVASMVPAMQACRSKEIMALLTEQSSGLDGDKLADILRGSSPSSDLMRSVLDFQYSTLKQLTLPYYQKLLLWFTLRDEKFFLAGKEQYIARLQQNVPDNTVSRPATGKISSKQVGDELLNGPSKKDDRASVAKRRKDQDDEEAAFNTTSAPYDAVRTWPLFCFELKFSVDQEERFLSVHKELVEGHAAGRNDLAHKRTQMAVAVSTTDNLGKAVGSISHVISKREERSFLGILTPKQTADFHVWLSQSSNRDRARRSISDDGRDSPSVHSMDATLATKGYEGSGKEVSLQDISRRLSEVLRISTKADE
jgi:bZIP transcription factor